MVLNIVFFIRNGMFFFIYFNGSSKFKYSCIAIFISFILIARAEGAPLNIVVSLPCTAYLCGSLIVF